jgi:hypothetical protein
MGQIGESLPCLLTLGPAHAFRWVRLSAHPVSVATAEVKNVGTPHLGRCMEQN